MHGWRSRSFLIALLGLGYVAFAALQSRGGGGPAWFALALLALGLALVWSYSAAPSRGIDPIDPAVRSAARACAAGSALVIAAWTGAVGHPSMLAAANLGTALASLSALVALARIAPGPGLLQPPATTQRLDALALGALFWGIALVLPLARSLFPERTAQLDPLAIDYATTTAATGSLGLIIASAMRVRALRRLELGVADRASAALVLSVVVAALSAPCALLRLAPADRIMSMGALGASGLVLFASITHESTTVARTMRTTLALVLLGAPLALGGVALSTGVPHSAGVVVLAVGVASALVGLGAPWLARPLGPARSRWLDAIGKASQAALQPDPDVALREALSTVRTVLPGDSGSPMLFRSSPAELLTVDRAGYLHTHAGEVPEHLYVIAQSEPESTVRTEVLRALEVRRADLRPIVRWLDARSLLAVSVVRDEDGPMGILGLPRGKRKTPMNLEEVRAFRQLADRLGAVLGVSSALARSRSREMQVRQLAEQRGDEIDRLKHLMASKGEQHRAQIERLAQPLVTSSYSAAASLAFEQVKKLGALGAPLTLQTPAGLDPVPWAAAAALCGARQDKPFVVVHGTDPAEQNLERWRDSLASPLTLAQTGTLMVVNVSSLPRTVQDFIASSLAERVSPSGSAAVLDVGLSVSIPDPVQELVQAGRLSAALLHWLGDHLVELPPLALRSEDFRALALDQLARLGMQLRGSPVGIEDRALALLIDHGWPGNDLEMSDVLLRAALVAKGARVTAEDLQSIGFGTVATPPANSPMRVEYVPPAESSRSRRRH